MTVRWLTSTQTAQRLGISKVRVSQLARSGRFGPNAYKKFSSELNYNGAWMIPFPNQYQKLEVGQGRPKNKGKDLLSL